MNIVFTSPYNFFKELAAVIGGGLFLQNISCPSNSRRRQPLLEQENNK